MQIGDKKKALVHIGEHMPVPMEGRVVWIHPQRRFYVLEFDKGGRRFRESYYFPGHGAPQN